MGGADRTARTGGALIGWRAVGGCCVVSFGSDIAQMQGSSLPGQQANMSPLIMLSAASPAFQHRSAALSPLAVTLHFDKISAIVINNHSSRATAACGCFRHQQGRSGVQAELRGTVESWGSWLRSTSSAQLRSDSSAWMCAENKAEIDKENKQLRSTGHRAGSCWLQ